MQLQCDTVTNTTAMGDRNDMEGVVRDEKKTWLQREKEKYQQQTTWVWRPEYTVHSMWKPFLWMGLIMLVSGSGLCFFAGGANEVSWDYTDCCENTPDILERSG